MQITPTSLPDVVLVTPSRFGDDRGFFSEVFRQDKFSAVAGDVIFVQDNHSMSAQVGTVRGLHFQAPPFAQGKLVRVTKGSVLDVAVDIRRGSPTYGHHVSVELTAENGKQLWVPPGFLHGFCTLQPYTEVVYKVTAYYDQKSDGGVVYDDPDIGIVFPFTRSEVVLSAKDEKQPRLKDLDNPFVYKG